MPSAPFTPIVQGLPSTVPFVGPEAQERKRGRKFRARLGANESLFGPSPKAIEAMRAAAAENWKYCDPENHDLKEGLARHYGIAPANIVVGEGIDGLFGTVARLFVEPGTPVATSQVVLLQALESGDAAAQVEAVRRLLAGRYRVLRDALAGCDPSLLAPLPFNSGCFALVALGPEARAAGLTAGAVRRHLLDTEDTGLVSIGDEYLRIAHCSVAEEDLPELVRRLERGVGTLARAAAVS